jgi:hypothetical protein
MVKPLFFQIEIEQGGKPGRKATGQEIGHTSPVEKICGYGGMENQE